MMKIAVNALLRDRLEQSLTEKFGGMVGGSDLANLLGYRSADTLRKAVVSKSLRLRTFLVPGRQGRFALTVEVVDWLVDLREGSDATDSDSQS